MLHILWNGLTVCLSRRQLIAMCQKPVKRCVTVGRVQHLEAATQERQRSPRVGLLPQSEENAVRELDVLLQEVAHQLDLACFFDLGPLFYGSLGL